MSCQEADKAEINRRLREKNAAVNARKKKGKVMKPTESSSAVPKTPQEEVPKGSSAHVKRHHITDTDAMIIYDEPVNKKTKEDDASFVPNPIENSIVVASAASVSFGQNASSLLVSSEDQDTLIRFTGSACGNQSVAHITQALKWASAQVAKTELYERQITKLEKEVADAKKRANEYLMKLSNVENKVNEAEKKLKVADDEIISLRKALTNKGEDLRIANDAKAEAQLYWYAEGLKDRLEAVKKAGLNHKLCYIDGVDVSSDDEEAINPNEQDNDGHNNNPDQSGEN